MLEVLRQRLNIRGHSAGKCGTKVEIPFLPHLFLRNSAEIACADLLTTRFGADGAMRDEYNMAENASPEPNFVIVTLRSSVGGWRSGDVGIL